MLAKTGYELICSLINKKATSESAEKKPSRLLGSKPRNLYEKTSQK